MPGTGLAIVVVVMVVVVMAVACICIVRARRTQRKSMFQRLYYITEITIKVFILHAARRKKLSLDWTMALHGILFIPCMCMFH